MTSIKCEFWPGRWFWRLPGAYAEVPKLLRSWAAAKTAGSGQMFCGPQGCRPVQPGCHIEPKVYMGMSGTMNMEVCK